MFSDNGAFKGLVEKDLMGMKSLSKDTHNLRMTGESIDRIFKKGKLVEEIHSHNLIVFPFLNLVMCLLKYETGYTGLQYWAVGSGSSAWDVSPATPDIRASRLTLEIGRLPLDASCFSFLDADYNEIDVPNNILQVRKVFAESDCNGIWREFGIFGGNATEEANSGIMINKRHHGVITKTDEMVVERTMRFVLNLV